MNLPGGKVLEFRRAVARHPVHPADALGRGVSLGVASPNSAPSDSPQYGQPRALHASESFGETLVRQRNDASFWLGWVHGCAFGVLAMSIIALLTWPR